MDVNFFFEINLVYIVSDLDLLVQDGALFIKDLGAFWVKSSRMQKSCKKDVPSPQRLCLKGTCFLSEHSFAPVHVFLLT